MLANLFLENLIGNLVLAVGEDPKLTLLGKNVPKQVPRKRLPSRYPGSVPRKSWFPSKISRSNWEPMLANLFLGALLESLFLATLLEKLFLTFLLGNLFLETLPGNFFREPYL